MIEELDIMVASLMERIHSLVNENSSEKFIKQIHFLESITGVGFLSAVTIMCEIGDFNSFKNPKQLFAYFGLNPSVSQSGKFQATEFHISKRGSMIARRALFAVALASVRSNRNGVPINPIMLAFYKKKTEAKAKKVALGAVMHKICNIIFAVLRDEKLYEIRTPQEHCLNYQSNQLVTAA